MVVWCSMDQQVCSLQTVCCSRRLGGDGANSRQAPLTVHGLFFLWMGYLRCVQEGAFSRLAAELESGYLGQARPAMWEIVFFFPALAGGQGKDFVGGSRQQRHCGLSPRARAPRALQESRPSPGICLRSSLKVFEDAIEAAGRSKAAGAGSLKLRELSFGMSNKGMAKPLPQPV